MSSWRAFSADGHNVSWTTWNGDHDEHLTLRWENEAWTATGHVGREDVEYVLRLSPSWRVRQFLLFRDLDEPDLWLANDGHARWGEVNGAHRPELDGVADIELACSPFPVTLPIRRLPLEVGDATELPVITVDVETLAVEVEHRRYEWLRDRRWRWTDTVRNEEREFDVDEFGVVVDQPGRFRRQP
ncbi:MAG: putative glycolipid-binding domain-containing protein [Ilumatobacteraceae bacterium]